MFCSLTLFVCLYSNLILAQKTRWNTFGKMPAKKLNDLKQTDEERIANEIFDAQKNTLCFRFLRRAVLFFQEVNAVWDERRRENCSGKRVEAMQYDVQSTAKKEVHLGRTY